MLDGQYSGWSGGIISIRVDKKYNFGDIMVKINFTQDIVDLMKHIESS